MTSDDDILSDESSSMSHTSSKSLNSEKEMFKFNLPYDLFKKIYPQVTTYKDKKKNKKNYEILKPHVWTDVINYAFLSAYKLLCNLIYKRCKVFSESGISKHYIFS
jgi:hypothetical protein